MQDKDPPLRLFGDLLSDLCQQITTSGNLRKNPYTIMTIGSGYHSYILDIKKKCQLKVGK